MFDGMMPDMPEDNQVSKSAEQVADAVSGTEKWRIEMTNHNHTIISVSGAKVALRFPYKGIWREPTTEDKALAERICALLNGVSSQTASAAPPVAGVSGRIAGELEKWLRAEAAERRQHAKSRRESADAERNATKEDRDAAHAIAERMHGRKIPKTTLAEDKKSAEMQDRIAAKLETEARMIESFADFVAQPYAEGDGWIAELRGGLRLVELALADEDVDGVPTWTRMRFWLNQRDIYNGDLQEHRVTLEVVKKLLTELPTPPSVQEEKGSSV